MAWVTNLNGNITEDSTLPIELLEELLLNNNLILSGDLKFKQLDDTFIDIRVNKDQGYDFGIWNDEADKYRLFIDNDGRLGVGTNAPHSLLTVINDTNNSEFAASIVNIGDLGKGLSVIAGDAEIANTTFTNKNGVDLVSILGNGVIQGIGPVSISSAPTDEGIRKYVMSTDGIDRIGLLHINEETGENNGGDMLLRTYSDLGDTLHNVLFISRSTGYIGVGTTSPNYHFDILGDINIGGTLYINGTAVDFSGAQVNNLGDILDVTLTTLNTGDIIVWDGTNWVNTPNSAGGAGFRYKGGWNANTNSPDLSSLGTNGDAYIVSVAGNTDLFGTTTWAVGDLVYKQNNIWTRIPTGTSAPVTSVAGKAGDVLLTSADIAEADNLFFTVDRARQAITNTIDAIKYDTITGVWSMDAAYKIPTTLEFTESLKYVSSGVFEDGTIQFKFNTNTDAFEVDLDGRYSLLDHEHEYDNYSAWKLNVGGITKSITSDIQVSISTDATMGITMDVISGELLFEGSAITHVELEDNMLMFTSIGASYGGGVDLSKLLEYVPSRVSPTLKAVGGIPEGTNYSELVNSSLSSIIDKMLFGDDVGASYTVPELTIIFTKDGEDVESVPPGTPLDGSFVYSATVALGDYKNDVGIPQGTYLEPSSTYTYNTYVNGILVDSQTREPATVIDLSLASTVISTNSIVKTEVVIPARDVSVTLLNNDVITLRLPSQVLVNERVVNAENPTYYGSYASVDDIPTTGDAFKAAATADQELETFPKNQTDKVYMLGVPKGVEIEVYDTGSMNIDYIANQFFDLSTVITSIPDASNVDVDYDVYVLTNVVAYSNDSDFKIIYKQ